MSSAKAAQRLFERQRRQRLPTFSAGGGSGVCEVRIGRLCYWNNNDDAPPPREPLPIAVARDTLLGRLAAAALAADSADEWIIAQRVRYLIEARRLDEAAAVADACRAAAWWCAALRGLVAHERSDHAAAAAAFDDALAGLSPAERCRWTDLSWWLDGALARDYRRHPCGLARDGWERRFWIVARPLLMLPGNDLRAELLARRTMSRIRSQGALEYQMAWGDDFAELEARYGWPTAWSARQSAPYSLAADPSIVGHEPTPSFAFVPRAGAVSAPAASDARDWDLDATPAVMRYAPRYTARGLAALPHQLARFRRGDSTLVVAAWDVDPAPWRADTTHADTTRAASADAARRDTLDAALVLVDTALAPIVARLNGAPWRGALAALVADGEYLSSIEIAGTVHRRAARSRSGMTTLPRDTLISDLLLLASPPPPDAPLDSLLAGALGSRTIIAGAPVGLYWETYFRPDSTPPAEVTVRATRIDAAWYERVGRTLRLDGLLGGGPQTPIAVRFADSPRPGTATLARALALTWPADAPGTYRLEVTVRAGDRAATAVEIVRVVRR